jgi:hypothetical protein
MAEQAHVARRRVRQAEQYSDHRGLPRAVGPEEAESRAARYPQIDTVERRARAEALGQTVRLDDQLRVGGRRIQCVGHR